MSLKTSSKLISYDVRGDRFENCVRRIPLRRGQLASTRNGFHPDIVVSTHGPRQARHHPWRREEVLIFVGTHFSGLDYRAWSVVLLNLGRWSRQTNGNWTY
jgi:hypothetical protein